MVLSAFGVLEHSQAFCLRPQPHLPDMADLLACPPLFPDNEFVTYNSQVCFHVYYISSTWRYFQITVLISLNKAFYNHKPCCDKKSNTVGHGCARVAHCVTARWLTSPTTAAHYVSMTSDLRVLSTEKHWPPADNARCTQTSVFSARTKYIVRHWTSSGWGTEAFPPQ